MSSTVTYKSNTLTTVNNQTKVLNTRGTWLEDNITITDVTSSGGGGGSSAQTATGSVTGDGTTTLAISCNFEPDLIYVYGDMSDSANNRGVVSITILKDAFVYMSSDSSTSNVTEDFAFGYHNISGYGDPTKMSVTYSNGTLTIDTVSNTSSRRFRSGQVYNYKLIKWTSG